jgi:hypothetical protein
LSCRYGTSSEHRIAVELVEADLEIGFNLTGLAESDLADSIRILSDAEDVYQDILARVAKLDPRDRENLAPLVGELRRAIDLANPH